MRKLVTVLGTLILSVLVAQFAWGYEGGVLLVDDDGNSPDVREHFEAALQAASLEPASPANRRGLYDVYDVTDSLGPPLSLLEQHEAVVWFTGAVCCSDPNCLSVEEEYNLGLYLEGGGKLFLSAQDYLSYWMDGALPTTSFPYQYLKIESIMNNVWQGPDHIAEGPPSPVPEAITEDMVFDLWNPFITKSGDLYIDKIEPIAPAKVDAHHVVGEFSIDDAAGTGFASLSWNETGGYDGAHVFFSTISFAALEDGAYTRGELMRRIMTWMLGDYADYGDAPDPTYYSMYETFDPVYGIPNVGARAENSDGIFEWLGDDGVIAQDIDLEFNSHQVDNDLFDDGVSFNFPYTPGAMGSVDITVWVTNPSATRYNMPFGDDNLHLHAWFDWDQDGNWFEAHDNVFCSVDHNPYNEAWPGNSMTYTITFPVPAGIPETGEIWTRFRLDYNDDVNWFGTAVSYGEVEDYKITLTGPVSIGLSSFYASAGDRQATLYWSTESEVNNAGFYLLRSEDGVRYTRVNDDLVTGQGTSETRHEYRYVDKGLVNGVTYSYKLVDVDLTGNRTAHGPISVTPQASSQVPTSYALSQNYPNPFNAQTTITYSIPNDSHVSMKVFNILGEEVRTLVDGQQSANTYQVTWDGKDADGKLTASGVYFCTLKAGEFSETMKMVFMK
jgi:hypothetical protein